MGKVTVEYTVEYTVKLVPDVPTTEQGVFRPDGALLLNCGEYGEGQAHRFAALLNSTLSILVFDFHEPAKGAVILSELNKRGFQIVSHTSILYDGAIINTVILLHPTRY